ncbi:hypothetical protein ACA910_018216 [Epithemia clementina (nom. ined.)]
MREATASTAEQSEPMVLQDLHRFLSYRAGSHAEKGSNKPEEMSPLFDMSAMAVPVAAMKVLLGVVERTEAETMMQLQDELRQAADLMMASSSTATTGRSNIALKSGCELFLKYITRTFLELPDFTQCKQAILERGQRFQSISLAARDRIAAQAAAFVPKNGTVLTHGYSRVVANILLEATKSNKQFDLIVLEGRPDDAGVKAAEFYVKAGIPVRICLDAAMGTIMEQVDVVLTGAEAIAENGGVINKVGTYALACCAAANSKPMYVAAESYKFARLYPLRQSDLPLDPKQPTSTSTTSSGIPIHNPSVDFTPSKFISLLFTDLGVLTPSAVSDELIRLYQ